MAPIEIPLENHTADYIGQKKMVADGTIKPGARADGLFNQYFDKYSKYGYINFKDAMVKIKNSLRKTSKYVKKCKSFEIDGYHG